jgi:sarcosine/dimethylglycine N-methyltransferase
MTDADTVRRHYGHDSLIDRLTRALGPEDQRLSPEQLAPLDQFHTLGIRATADLAGLAGITADTRVLDIGSGLGGPARWLAATHGCRVTGVDLSEPFVEAARYLTRRTGQAGTVAFEVASALDLPFDAGQFDVALLQHVAMNIADRARLYGEIRRVLMPGGRFATFDVVAGEGTPLYPVPWARMPDVSCLLTAQATRAAIEAAGFINLAWRDDTEAAQAWFARMHQAGPSSGPNLSLVMGEDFTVLTGNLARNLTEGRLGVITAGFEAR